MDGASKQNVRPRRLTLVPTVSNSNNFRTLASSKIKSFYHNDPTAGSPTVTLLRLLLPLNDQV